MNLFQRWRAWRERRRTEARARRMQYLRRALATIQSESNTGRAQRLLSELPEVVRVRTERGDWQLPSVLVTLRDGRDFYARDLPTIKAIHEAAGRVVAHLLTSGENSP